MMAKFSQAYQHHKVTSQLTWVRFLILGCILVFAGLLATRFSDTAASSESGLTSARTGAKRINALTWNVAAINNNPFEYWITNEDPKYNALMKNVSAFIENPADQDILVEKIFSDEMFEELAEKMTSVGWTGVDEVRKYWQTDFKLRKIISGFVKDGMLGKKRLASMPDRVTNTIHTTDGQNAMRPTVINCFAGEMSTVKIWWSRWLDFYFTQPITVTKGGKAVTTKIFEMISSIKKSKYPDITAEEEAVSEPLQTLALAIFDAILVHMMTVVGSNTWEPLRADICQKLNTKKNDRTVEILQTTYADMDIQFLQEVAGNFLSFAAKHPIASLYDIHQSASMDTERDQNSYILLKKGRYKEVTEMTDKVVSFAVERNNGTKLPLVNGDLLVLVAVDATDNTRYLLASFHGDTNGLATKPIVLAVQDFALSQLPNCKLLFGLDANTYAKPEKDQQGVVDFGNFYTNLKLNSCYGPHPIPQNFTTFHARTHLQPQLNKAISLEQKDVKGDKNPKDFILFFNADFTVLSTTKDNTGKKEYIENMVFPTLSFPSDHGITSTVVAEVGSEKKYLKTRD
eukprot:gene14799-16970_t